MESDLFKMLVDRIDRASQRSRWVFSVSIVISLALIGSVWNFSSGSLRGFVERQVIVPSTTAAAAVALPSSSPASSPQSERLAEMQKELLKSWVDSLSISVGLIGMKFSVTDAGLIGGVLLLVITVWMFFCIRRECHLIGRTIELAEGKEDPALRSYVFWGILSTQIFNTLSDDDSPVDISRETKKSTQHIARWTKAAMAYLPALALASYIVVDFLNVMHLKSVFSGIDKTPFERYGLGVFQHVLPTTTFEIVMLAMLVRLIGSIRKLQDSTKANLQTLRLRGWDQPFRSNEQQHTDA